MWHEARRQEKLIRSQMIDSVKRNERRKLFYENVVCYFGHIKICAMNDCEWELTVQQHFFFFFCLEFLPKTYTLLQLAIPTSKFFKEEENDLCFDREKKANFRH